MLRTIQQFCKLWLMPIVIAAVPWLHPHRIFPAPKLQYFCYRPMLLHYMVLLNYYIIRQTVHFHAGVWIRRRGRHAKYAPAGRNRSASDVSRYRLSSVKLHNHKVGYFDPLLWDVHVTIIVETFCIGGKYSVVLYLCSIRYGRYGGMSSLIIK